MVDTEQQTESVHDRLTRLGFFMDRQGQQFVLYKGLLDTAHQQGLVSLKVEEVQVADATNGMSAVMKATAIFKDGREFTEIGDASPENSNRMMALHVNRFAATRAKARALRDALNIGVAAFEELADEGAEAQDTPQAARPVQVPQNLIDDFERESGMPQTTSQRTNYNRPPQQGGQQGQKQFQTPTGPTGRPTSPKQRTILDRNETFSAPNVPSHEEACKDGGLASIRIDAIFAADKGRSGGSFR